MKKSYKLLFVDSNVIEIVNKDSSFNLREKKFMDFERDLMVTPVKINIKPLKKFADEKLPNRSLLKKLLLTEKEILTISEFLTKMDLWVKIFNHEYGGKIVSPYLGMEENVRDVNN